VSGGSPVPGLLDDLVAERVELGALLAGQPDGVWGAPTPAAGWTVHDQVAHLAHFDEVTRMCVAEPAAFEEFRDGLADLQTYVDGVGARFGHLGPGEMLAWWTRANEELVRAARAADPKVRVPWFGPAMSLASKVTARIMETWAHGQDVYDTVGAVHQPSPRLRHVARIGVLAFPNSFRARGLEVPRAEVHVDLAAPDGGRWTWGDPAAADAVHGPAEDFCLVITQRRHVADTRLEVRGEVAIRWMQVAQAFAGPPGTGRTPGQFPPAGATGVRVP
jgi:uncharacterized protein (TIGR03084 family)